MGKINRIREWREKRGLKLEDLAERIDLSGSYLSRLETEDRNVSLKHIRAIAAALDVSERDLVAYEELTAVKNVEPPRAEAKSGGFHEESEPYRVGAATPTFARTVAMLLEGRPNAHARTVKSDMLAPIGIGSGDTIIVDQILAESAKAGDVVCAQFEDGLDIWTIFRLYQPPFLTIPGSAPLEVNGEDVRIVGVVTEHLKRRD